MFVLKGLWEHSDTRLFGAICGCVGNRMAELTQRLLCSQRIKYLPSCLLPTQWPNACSGAQTYTLSGTYLQAQATLGMNAFVHTDYRTCLCRGILVYCMNDFKNGKAIFSWKQFLAGGGKARRDWMRRGRRGVSSWGDCTGNGSRKGLRRQRAARRGGRG